MPEQTQDLSLGEFIQTPSGYQIEILKQVGPDDAEWERQTCVYGVKRVVIGDAKRMVKPTEHGPSGVRVVDNRTEEVVWSNC